VDRFSESAGRLAGIAGALLGWRPDEFWKATPAELGAVIRAVAGPGEAGVDRSQLDALMGRFPDG
jgi:uncharacterized phage protein (TIGR02216 family)